ncbi:putative metal-binding motif-containing protein, partial [Nannocystis pusilla]|uniref:putative metal-binding motif-containing protein n=1 Tax=Nannocystis pusilla TaxID=889268 RepID=UPI003BF45171
GDGHYAAACGGDDCDDEDSASHPGASELCDGRDNDCDAAVPAKWNQLFGEPSAHGHKGRSGSMPGRRRRENARPGLAQGWDQAVPDVPSYVRRRPIALVRRRSRTVGARSLAT